MKRLSKTLIEKIKAIKLLILDVDGVLTDGRIIYDDDGRQIKAFDVKDGHGIKLLMQGGVDVGIITARESRVILHRAKDLGIDIVYQKAIDKVKAFQEIIDKRGLQPNEVAYVGDDIVDLSILRRVGFSAAVNDSVEDIRGSVDWVTTKQGGRGAVREICELILKVQGKWEKVTERYMR
ncbi:MAG: HAD-IIIA family hydrolase [Deltaproteobacteria bacterium]|nr:HAD-IIIA family hydrolase [Deltaproteobacteria bacterium]